MFAKFFSNNIVRTIAEQVIGIALIVITRVYVNSHKVFGCGAMLISLVADFFANTAKNT